MSSVICNVSYSRLFGGVRSPTKNRYHTLPYRVSRKAPAGHMGTSVQRSTDGMQRRARSLYRLVQAHNPEFLQMPMSTPFSRIDSKIKNTCLMCPRRAFREWVFRLLVFFVRELGLFVFVRYLVSRDPSFSAKKKQKQKQKTFARDSARTH